MENARQEGLPVARGPLGVITVFLSLVQALAVVTLVWSDHVTEGQRWVFVVFFVAFPMVSFAAFFRLVTKHHRFLYPPSEFKNEALVFSPQPSEIAESRVLLETAQSLEEVEPKGDDLEVDSKSQTGTGDNGEAISEANLSRVVPPSPGSAVRARSEIIREVETLALNRLAQELGVSPQRGVVLEANGVCVPFDAVFRTPNVLHIAEVRFSETYRISRDFVMDLKGRVRAILPAIQVAYPGQTIILDVFVVVEHLAPGQETGVKTRLLGLLADLPVTHQIHCSSLGDLREAPQDRSRSNR